MSNRSIEVTSSRSLATADGRGDVKIKTIISSTTFQCLVLPPANSISVSVFVRACVKSIVRDCSVSFSSMR